MTAPVVIRSLDLNADLGELPGAAGRDLDAALLAVVSSANVATGGHAGDAASMRRVCEGAAAHGVAIGAHLSYVDRAGFGRRSLDVPLGRLRTELERQLADLQDAATAAGTTVRYVKPHGALYHDAAQRSEIATVVLEVCAGGGLGVLSLPGRLLVSRAPQHGIAGFREAFADRAYAADGTLVPRDTPGAVLTDPDVIVARVVGFAAGVPLTVDSVCVHGDTPGAVELARRSAAALTAAGIAVRPFTPGP